MVERTKIAHDLDDRDYKSWKSCVSGKKEFKLYLPKNQRMLLASFLLIGMGRAPARVYVALTACRRCFLPSVGK